MLKWGILVESQLFDLSAECIRLNRHHLRRFGEIAAGLLECGADLVLELPVLHDAVEGALTDAEQAGSFLAVACRQFEGLFGVKAVDFAQGAADQLGGACWPRLG